MVLRQLELRCQFWCIITFIKEPIATAKAPLRIDAVHLLVCPFVFSLSVAKRRTQKRSFLKN